MPHALVVDDDIDSAASLRELIAGERFTVAVAHNLRDARRQISLQQPDILLLDLRLPDGNGMDLLADPQLVANTEVVLCTFPRDALWRLHEQLPSLGYDITGLAAHEESIVDENLISVGRRTAAERVAMLLIRLYKRAAALQLPEAGRAVPFPITQQHIADALGLSLVHTNKTLRRLQKLGLYSIADGRLTLTDPGALERMADWYGSGVPEARPLI